MRGDVWALRLPIEEGDEPILIAGTPANEWGGRLSPDDEWIAYGYGFPPIGERISTFEEHLEVITRMIAPGRATYEGERVHVIGAINEPRSIQARIPLIVGGNGRVRTAGLAVRFADELNWVFIGPAEARERMVEVRAKCEAAGRDPASLRFSVYTLDEDYTDAGQVTTCHNATSQC